MNEALGLAVLVGWFLWAIACAGLLRVSLAMALKYFIPALRFPANLPAIYAAMIAIFVGSIFIHNAILGDFTLYGATPRQGFSFQAYLLAPFGLPLLLGGHVVFVAEILGVPVLFRWIAGAGGVSRR